MNSVHFTCGLYLRKGVVYITTYGYSEGLWIQVEPVSAIPLSNIADLRQAIRETIERGSPRIDIRPGPRQGSIVSDCAGIKSWSAFMRDATSFSLSRRKNSPYEIETYKKMASGSGYEPDGSQTVVLPGDADVDQVCDRMIDVIRKKAEGGA